MFGRQNMKVYIPFDYYTSTGGPTTFMGNLKTYLQNKQYPFVKNIDEADTIFFPISFDQHILRSFKQRGGKIIQRLDGVYYPSKHGNEYTKFNQDVKDIYANLSDFVVFQSQYSKKQCYTMFGEKDESQYQIVVNGVDKSIFYPSEVNTKLGAEINFVTTGNFRNVDMIEPVVQALDQLRNKLSFRLNVIGPITNPELGKFFQRDYVVTWGDKKLPEVAEFLRRFDIFVYSHLNPPCPNSVVEAIASGLPLVGFDSGAMSELAFFSKSCWLLYQMNYSKNMQILTLTG